MLDRLARVAREGLWAPAAVFVAHEILARRFGHEPLVDPVAHFLGGVSIYLLAYRACVVGRRRLGEPSRLAFELIAAGAALAAAVGWELAELASDLLFRTAIQTSAPNTLRDLALGGAGAVCGALAGRGAALRGALAHGIQSVMPFGAFFAAIVFGLLGPWFGFRLLHTSSPLVAATGVFLIVLGISLAAGLLMRQAWARWMGLLGAAFIAFAAFGQAMVHTNVLNLLLLFAAGLAGALLLFPPTGRIRRDSPPERGAKIAGGALAAVATLAILGLAGASAFAVLARPMRAAREAVAIPAGDPAAVGSAVDWLDFVPGLEKAKADDKLALVDFFAEWCGPCKMMDRKTFRDPRVVARLSDVVTVRVDSEEETERHGVAGLALAERYAVETYPTLMLLNGEGRIVSRRSGYLGPGELLAWIDDVLPHKAEILRGKDAVAGSAAH